MHINMSLFNKRFLILFLPIVLVALFCACAYENRISEKPPNTAADLKTIDFKDEPGLFINARSEINDLPIDAAHFSFFCADPYLFLQTGDYVLMYNTQTRCMEKALDLWVLYGDAATSISPAPDGSFAISFTADKEQYYLIDCQNEKALFLTSVYSKEAVEVCRDLIPKGLRDIYDDLVFPIVFFKSDRGTDDPEYTRLRNDKAYLTDAWFSVEKRAVLLVKRETAPTVADLEFVILEYPDTPAS